MFVPPSLESIALTFGVFRSGAVCTLIDPGMGRGNVFGVGILGQVNRPVKLNKAVILKTHKKYFFTN